tara:strand:- start:21312 stop:21833 length:522 start_codon:yes stop_codon:yes gene_type:complete
MKLSELSKTHRRIRWLSQCMLVFLTMAIFLYLANVVLGRTELIGAIGATSLGSTAFLAFVAHNSYMAQSKRILGGYLIAIVVGIVLFHCVQWTFNAHIQINHRYLVLFVAAASAAIGMFFMTLLGLEHPPAAGLSLGMVLEHWDMKILGIIVACLLLLTVIKYLLRNWLVVLV